MTTGPRRRSWLGSRWRQARNPPPPVLRAVVANLSIAGGGGLLLLLYDRLTRGWAIDAPGAGLLAPLTAVYVAAVLVSGSLLTYLWVELPTGATGERRRSGWAALLGLFAGVPITYLVLVVAFQVVRPMLS